MMNQSLTVRFTPNQQDYTNVVRIYFWKRTSTKISLAVLALAFGVILFMVISRGTPPSPIELLWLLLPPLFVVYAYFIQPSRMASQAVRNEQLTAENTWQVSDAGLEISTSFRTANLAWESFEKMVATREYYLLHFKDKKYAFRFLPRRAFSSPSEQNQFLELVAHHLRLA